MADPVYDDHRIDLVTITFAVVLAAAIVFLLAELVTTNGSSRFASTSTQCSI